MEEMFRVSDIRNTNWFWFDKKIYEEEMEHIGVIGFAIYGALCYYAKQETAECFPAVSTILKKLNISEPTFHKYLKMLKNRKLIKVISGRKQGKVNHYFILDLSRKGLKELKTPLKELKTPRPKSLRPIMNNNKEQEELTIVEQSKTLLTQFPINLTPLVEEYLELARNENKTKMITDRKKHRLITELLEVFKQVGESKFQQGLRVTLDKEVPNINYLKKVCKGLEKRDNSSTPAPVQVVNNIYMQPSTRRRDTAQKYLEMARTQKKTPYEDVEKHIKKMRKII